jgi:hypothetical protein
LSTITTGLPSRAKKVTGSHASDSSANDANLSAGIHGSFDIADPSDTPSLRHALAGQPFQVFWQQIFRPVDNPQVFRATAFDGGLSQATASAHATV